MIQLCENLDSDIRHENNLVKVNEKNEWRNICGKQR